MGGGAQANIIVSPASELGMCAPNDEIIVVGGYTNTELLAHTPAPCDDPARCGVHVLRQCGVTGRLTHLSTNAIGPNVAFIVRSPTNPSILYASTERIDDEGEIITLRMTPDFRLVEETRIKAGGRSTCYLNFNASREWMMAVNYWDARVSMFKLGKDGRPDIEAGRDPRWVLQQPGADYVDRVKPTREEHWKFRQRWPHSHCCVTEPYAGLVHFVVDLGLDKVFTYRVNSKTGVLVPKGSTRLPPGKGPRHLVFHPTVRSAYLVNELDSTVSVFKVNIPEEWTTPHHWDAGASREDGCEEPGAVLELTQCLSSLPESEQGKTTISPQGIWKAASHSSEIRMHPNGRYFAVGNRGHDSIALYAVDQSDGTIALVDIVKSGGECPRNFNWTCGGKFLVVGNQNTNCMATMSFDEASGALKIVHEAGAGVTSPNYVYAIPARELPSLISSADGFGGALPAIAA
jgi:6-phosphogluconolactonase